MYSISSKYTFPHTAIHLPSSLPEISQMVKAVKGFSHEQITLCVSNLKSSNYRPGVIAQLIMKNSYNGPGEQQG